MNYGMAGELYEYHWWEDTFVMSSGKTCTSRGCDCNCGGVQFPYVAVLFIEGTGEVC